MIDIPGFEGRYGVTDDGRVWSYPKLYGANLSRRHDGLWVSPFENHKGYIRACLTLTDGRQRSYFVHRLVALAYLPNPSGFPQVNHKNGKKNDNRASNLGWVTQSENIRHAYAAGLMPATEEKSRIALRAIRR